MTTARKPKTNDNTYFEFKSEEFGKENSQCSSNCKKKKYGK